MQETTHHYRHLQEHFAYQIRRGALKPYNKLPSEREIGEQFKLTRMTVRHALQQLEAEGLIYRENRRGWFVSPAPAVYDPARRKSFVDYVAEQGGVPKTELMSQTLAPVPPELSDRMGLERQTPVMLLKRRRFIDNRPVLIEHNYLNPLLLPGLEDHDLSRSLTRLLREHYQTEYDAMDLVIRSATLPLEATESLGVSPGLPGLYIERTNLSKDQKVLEIDFEYWRHDAVTMSLTYR